MKAVVAVVAVLLVAWAGVNLVPILVVGLRTSSCESRIDTRITLSNMKGGTRSRLDSA